MAAWNWMECWDKEYLETKLIKQGKKSINVQFKEPAIWISENYEVTVLNLCFKVFDQGSLPSLCVVLDEYSDEEKLKNDELKYSQKGKDEIDKKYKEIVQNQKLTSIELPVIFSVFRYTSIEDANCSISKDEIEDLISKLGVKELNQIARSMSTAVFFLETDKDVRRCKRNGMKETFQSEYARLIKKYDEFNYINEQEYRIYLDSMENLRKNHKGLLDFYFK